LQRLIKSSIWVVAPLFGAVQKWSLQGAQKTEPRGVYGYTLSGAVCSATQQMSVFQQPTLLTFLDQQQPLR